LPGWALGILWVSMEPSRLGRRRVNLQALARKTARRAALLDAADRAIRRAGPSVTMDEIAAEAGTAKPVLYRHFGDKGGLYQALAQRYVQVVMDAIRDATRDQDHPRARLEAAIDAYLAVVETSPEIYRFLMHRAVTERAEAQATVADFIHQLGGELAADLGDRLRRFGLDTEGAEPWARGIVGMVQVAGDWWLEHRAAMPRERLVDHLVGLLWQGFSGLGSGANQTPEEAI
jgi:AcrR family transcriptional regulator